MRKKDRQKAAQKRDEQLFAQGAQDELLRSELLTVRAQKSASDWAATCKRVAEDAQRPSSPYHMQAVVTMGALSVIEAAA